MIRFWLEFDDDACPGHPAAIGVTAHDLDDAIALVKRHWNLPVESRCSPAEVVQDIDVSTLPSWVLASIGLPPSRGIWYPISNVEGPVEH